MSTGAQQLVGALERAGVEVAFGLPGVHNLAAWKALAASPIRLVGVRHEQAAAYAADGYARATGRIGVALTTTGPGAANTLGAVGEAYASGSPILVVATDIPTTLRRPGVLRGALHETTDQAAMFRPVTKGGFQAVAGERLDDLAAEAIALALEPATRPVYLEIPTDLLIAELDHMAPNHIRGSGVVMLDDHDPAPERAAALLREARHPVIWAGGGALRGGAGTQVGRLAALLGAPVIETYMAKGLLPLDHPCRVGLPPHVPQCGQLWDDADVVVAIGSDLDGMTTQNWAQPQPPRMIAVNIDAADATKNYAADLVLAGEVGVMTAALIDAVKDGAPDLEALRRDLQARRDAVRADLLALQPAAVEFLDVVAAVLPDEAILVADMCIPGYWLGGFHPVASARGLQYPVGWGTLGFAFPAALGASMAGRGPVVSFSGDGGFLFACGELATMAQEQLPFTAVIVDDGGYGMLRFDQRHAGDPTFGVDLRSPDFAAMAAAFGVRAQTVEGLGAAFGTALAQHIADPLPSVLVAKAQLDPPPTTSPRWYRRP